MRLSERTDEPLKRFFIDLEPTAAQHAEEWSRIRDRISDGAAASPAARRTIRIVLAAAALGVLLFGVRTYMASLTEPAAGSAIAVVEGPVTKTLVDGSEVMVEKGGRVRIAEGWPHLIQIHLDTGEAAFDVSHRPDRTFVVSAGGVEVRVVGTRFRVRMEERPEGGGSAVRVSVSRGTVEVSRVWDPSSVRVTAGEERLFEDGGPGAWTDARGLFEQANRIRRAGRAAEAARLYNTLLARFPTDQRAGLAALELGRLRMDTLGDLPGAADALRKAVATTPRGSLNEDAQARMVDALDGLRDWPRCRRARSEYLQRYRKGVHASAVSAQCAGH